MKKISQILAIEKGIKGRHHSEISELYKQVQKPALFAGLNKTYKKKDENGDDLPPENQKVQCTWQSVLESLKTRTVELFDITAAKDFSNCKAKADVVVDGVIMLKDAPPPYLLFLEKQLTDIRTFVDTLPVLDATEEWKFDENAGVYKTDEVKSARTKKLQQPIVLYPATTEHPAQTQLITEDVQVGIWCTIKQSGAIPKHKKLEMLGRIETLLKAVKCAREEANGAEAQEEKPGKAIFDYILGS